QETRLPSAIHRTALCLETALLTRRKHFSRFIFSLSSPRLSPSPSTRDHSHPSVGCSIRGPRVRLAPPHYAGSPSDRGLGSSSAHPRGSARRRRLCSELSRGKRCEAWELATVLRIAWRCHPPRPLASRGRHTRGRYG